MEDIRVFLSFHVLIGSSYRIQNIRAQPKICCGENVWRVLSKSDLQHITRRVPDRSVGYKTFRSNTICARPINDWKKPWVRLRESNVNDNTKGKHRVAANSVMVRTWSTILLSVYFVSIFIPTAPVSALIGALYSVRGTMASNQIWLKKVQRCKLHPQL